MTACDPRAEARIDELARQPDLLVASDYDGTLAPIVDDPADAVPHREAVAALTMLASLPRTHVAVISGRALADLAGLTSLPGHVHLVGSHGSEFDPGFHSELPRDALVLRERIAEHLARIAARWEGVTLEHKPASVAMHYRMANEENARRALAEVQAGPATLPGVHVKHGKQVVELCAIEPDKGSALNRIRRQTGARAVLFLGDDVTDEDAFAVLRDCDLGVKIGAGDTAATARVDTTEDACRLLARLAERRSDWLERASAVPIEHHALLSDMRTLALVTPGGRITWMCAPRVDSSALFADLLGGEQAGHFTVRAEHGEPRSQAYRPDAMVLETDWGEWKTTDLLDISGGRGSQRAGRTDLIRRLTGHGEAFVEFAPRLDFGRIPTRMAVHEGGLVVEDTHDPIVLRSLGVTWTIEERGPHQTAVARIPLSGEPVTLELRYGSGSLGPARIPLTRCIEETEQAWRRWCERLTVPSRRPELVRHSALILKAL